MWLCVVDSEALLLRTWKEDAMVQDVEDAMTLNLAADPKCHREVVYILHEQTHALAIYILVAS